MLPVEFPVHPQHRENREHKHRLQLEAEGQGGADHRTDGLVRKRQIQRDHKKRGIAAVALSPNGAVEKNRGEEEHREKAAKQRSGLIREAGQQLGGAPGEQYVKGGAEKLDQIQIPHGQQGEEREKI